MNDSRFTPIPNSLMENNTLSSGAILLLMRLLRLRYLHELEGAGLIRLAQVEDDNTFLTVTQVEVISKGADNDQ
jgi:hypothetical protein